MPTLYEGLTQAFTDPMMGVAAGLLGGAAPGGSLGQGLQQGLILSQQMQMNNARQDMATRQLTQRIEEQRWKRMAQERDWETERLAREQAALTSGQYGIQPGLEPTTKQIQAYSAGIRPGTEAWAEAMQPTPQVQISMGGADAGANLITGPAAAELGLNPTSVYQRDPKTGKISTVESGQEERKAKASVSGMTDALSTYETQLDKTGPVIMPGSDKLQLETAYNDLMMKAKEYYELGALTGPDMDLIQSTIMNPTSLQAQLYGKQALKDQLEQFQQIIGQAESRIQQQYGESTPRQEPRTIDWSDL